MTRKDVKKRRGKVQKRDFHYHNHPLQEPAKGCSSLSGLKGGPWKHGSFAATALISFNGLLGLSSGIIGFALSLFLYGKGHTPQVMAMAFFCQQAPKIYGGFWAGALADFLGKDRVMRLSVCGVLLLYAGTALGWNFFQDSPWHLLGVLGILVVLGSISAFYDVAFMASVSAFVPQNRYTFIYGLVEFSGSSNSLLVPIFGSFLYTVIPMRGFFLWGTLSAGILWIGLLCLSFPPSLRAQSAATITHETSFHLINQKPLLRELLFYFAGFNFLNGLAAGLILPYVLQCCSGHTPSLGVFSFWSALGAVLGSCMSFQRFAPPLPLIVSSSFLSSFCGRILFGFSQSLFSLSLWSAVRTGLCPLINTANQVLWSKETPPENRGRVFGTRRLIAQGGYPLGILCGGGLYSMMQIGGYQDMGLLIAGLGCLECFLTGIFFLRLKREKLLSNSIKTLRPVDAGWGKEGCATTRGFNNQGVSKTKDCKKASQSFYCD